MWVQVPLHAPASTCCGIGGGEGGWECRRTLHIGEVARVVYGACFENRRSQRWGPGVRIPLSPPVSRYALMAEIWKTHRVQTPASHCSCRFETCSGHFFLVECSQDGGGGRRAELKTRWAMSPCWFEPSSWHQALTSRWPHSLRTGFRENRSEWAGRGTLDQREIVSTTRRRSMVRTHQVPPVALSSSFFFSAAFFEGSCSRRVRIRGRAAYAPPS
jgi:hypothetical protein